MANLICTLSGLLALGACGIASRLPTTLESPKPRIQSFEFFSASIPGLSGAAVDLSSFKTKPLFVMFAGDTCIVCSEETRTLVNRAKEFEPYELRLVTVLAGADKVTAEEWKSEHKVAWTIAYDENLELFERYCPAGTTPCSFLQVPSRGIVLQKVGALAISELLQKLEEEKIHDVR